MREIYVCPSVSYLYISIVKIYIIMKNILNYLQVLYDKIIYTWIVDIIDHDLYVRIIPNVSGGEGLCYRNSGQLRRIICTTVVTCGLSPWYRKITDFDKSPQFYFIWMFSVLSISLLSILREKSNSMIYFYTVKTQINHFDIHNMVLCNFVSLYNNCILW